MGKYAIFIVSALIFSLLTYSSALRNALFQSNFRNIDSFSQNQAYNIAQSAALVTINDIRNDTDSDFVPSEGNTYSYPSSTGYSNWEDLSGQYNLQVTNQGDTLLVIRSTGRFEETNYQTTVGLTKGGFSQWLPASVDKAIHAESDMNLGNGDVIGDLSLNSPYNEFSSGPNADVDGSLYFYDPNRHPDEGDVEDDRMSGGVYTLSEEIKHPLPVFPTWPPINSTQEYSGRNETIDLSGSGVGMYNAFSANNTTINTGGEDSASKLYVKNLDLSKNINLSGEGHLSIYVEESMRLGKGMINADGQSKNLTIYYKGIEDIEYSNDISYQGNGTFRGLLFAGASNVSIEIGGNSTFDGNIISYGTQDVILHGNPENSALVLAPYAHVELKGTAGSFRGAIVSDTFTNSGGPSVIYDPEFASTLPYLEQPDDAEYVLLYWN